MTILKDLWLYTDMIFYEYNFNNNEQAGWFAGVQQHLQQISYITAMKWSMTDVYN